MIINDDALTVLKRMDSESVHMAVTSSPYYGLRSYGTEPIVWDGDPNCQHEWISKPIIRKGSTNGRELSTLVSAGSEKTIATGNTNSIGKTKQFRSDTSNFCSKCGAWKGELGQEPTPELFVKHLTTIFHELKRVLRNDGIFWMNIGDSYWGGKGKSGSGDPEDQESRHNNGYSINRAHHQIAGSGKMRPTDGKHPVIKPKDLIGIPWALAFSMRADGAASPQTMYTVEKIKSSLLQDYNTWNDVPQHTKRTIEDLDEEWLKASKGGWYLRADIPWIKRNCLGSGTILYIRSQKGVMPSTIHDLIRLDPNTVELWNGNKWTRIVDMHRTEIISDGVEIEFRSGEKITCTKEHRWPTKRGLLYSSELKIGDVIEKITLPNTENDGPKYIPDSIGRIVGLFLAEGSYLTRTEMDGIVFTFSKEERHLDEEVKKFALEYGGSHHSHSYENDGKLMSVIHGKLPMAIIMNYISNKGSKQKRLSNACWLRNNEFLKNLLIGYLEGDGHNDIKNHRWRLGFCKNDNLAKDIRTLCARLGISLRLKRGQCSAIKGGKLHQIWRGQIRFDQINQSINNACFKHTEDTEIISISKAKTQHFYDIGVEDEPHLFALASGILTHNSMPSSVTDRPGSSIEHIFLFSKSPKYYYDHIATMQPSSESYNKDKRPRGVIRQCVNETSKYPDAGQFKKQDGTGNETYTGFNSRYEPNGFGLRYMRDSDFFFKTWQGLLHNEDGEPMALVVNPKGYKGAHFAAFPIRLVEPLILAGSSDKGVCPKCGAPWVRVIVKKQTGERLVNGEYKISKGGRKRLSAPGSEILSEASAFKTGMWMTPETVDWKPTCTCDLDPIPATVIDPFSGSSATGVACKLHNRTYIGIELNPNYCKLGEQRIKEGK